MPNDKRRQRYRSKKQDQDNKPNSHYILAKRPEEQRQPLVQPKILLKTRTTINDGIITRQQEAAPIKTIIIQRSTDNQTKSVNSNPNGIITPSSSIITGAHKYTDSHDPTLQEQPQQDEHPIRKIMRAMTLISGTGVLNFNSRKVLNKNSTDFLVVGVVGEAGVGKTTVMNLLARDQIPEMPEGVDSEDDAFYRNVFCFTGGKRPKGENVFNTKLKNPTRARTESFLMYINGERTILIDSPPILNAQRRQVTPHNELTDLKNVVNLMNICHILIVVYEGTLNLEVLRLLRLALHTKPEKLSKLHTRNYLPSVMFIKNRAKRLEYTLSNIDRTHKIIGSIFDNTNLNVYFGTSSSSAEASTMMAIDSKNISMPIKDDQQQQQQVGDQQEKDNDKDTSRNSLSTKTIEPEQKKFEPINHLMFPQFHSSNSTTFHPSLIELTRQLRERVRATSHSKMFESNQPFDEIDWFDTVIKSIQEGLQKFEEPFGENSKKYKAQHHETTTATNSKTHAKNMSCGNESSNSKNSNASNHSHNHNPIGSFMDLCIGNKIRDRARDRRVSHSISKT